MSQRNLSNWLKAVIIGMLIIGIVIYAVLVPMMANGIVDSYPEYESWYIPWMIVIWATAIPCFAILGFSWLIAGNIGRDRSFCIANAHFLKMISVMAAIDTIFFFLANVVFLVLNMTHPLVMIVSIFICAAGIAVIVAAAALSHLVLKAASLQEQSDLTI